MGRRFSFRAAPEHRGLRLDQFLAAVLPDACGEAVSRRRIRRRIAGGAVTLDGRRTKVASRAMRPGARVEIHFDPASPEAPQPRAIDGSAILFEDAHLIAVAKPSGVAAQATPADDVHHLYARVRRFLAERDGARRSGRVPYLALHHRLDRGTSGVMLLAKTRPANRGLAEAFRERRVRKLYLALAAAGDDPAPDEWSVQNRLAVRKIEGGRRTTSVSAGGRSAETAFRVRERLAGSLLLEARPRTGRSHQIRVHLADSGMPVLGDRLYGPAMPRQASPRLMLHAAELVLAHPVTASELVVACPLPEDFRRLLETLRADSPAGAGQATL